MTLARADVRRRRKPRSWENYPVFPQAPSWYTAAPTEIDYQQLTMPDELQQRPAAPPTAISPTTPVSQQPPTAIPQSSEDELSPQEEMRLIAEMADLYAKGGVTPPTDYDTEVPDEVMGEELAGRVRDFQTPTIPTEVEPSITYPDWKTLPPSQRYTGIPLSQLRGDEIQELAKEEKQRKETESQERMREIYEQMKAEGRVGQPPQIVSETYLGGRIAKARHREAIGRLREAHETRVAGIKAPRLERLERERLSKPPTEWDTMEHEKEVERLKVGGKQRPLIGQVTERDVYKARVDELPYRIAELRMQIELWRKQIEDYGWGNRKEKKQLNNQIDETQGKITRYEQELDELTTQTAMPVIYSEEDLANLPSGTRFRTPDGKVKIKP